MINLAPGHKFGLPVANPVLVAGGMAGYGEALHKGVETAKLGAVVVGPIMARSRAGADGPRLAQTNGGFVLETGLQNRGVKTVLKRFAKLWPRLGCPVIAQIADSQPHRLEQAAAQLTSAQGLSGVELLLPPHVTEAAAAHLVETALHATDLPVWIKLPLEQAPDLAVAGVNAGAVGVVVGRPARATLPAAGPATLTGALYGPLAFGLMVDALVRVAALDLPVALIAAGGIHTPAQARQCLAIGAQAVQIDSALWVEPGLANALAKELG